MPRLLAAAVKLPPRTTCVKARISPRSALGRCASIWDNLPDDAAIVSRGAAAGEETFHPRSAARCSAAWFGRACHDTWDPMQFADGDEAAAVVDSLRRLVHGLRVSAHVAE